MNVLKKIIKIICSRCVYPMISLALKRKKTDITDIVANEALKELHKFSPDLGGSCLDTKIVCGGG
jgi:hypothetical protein